MESTAGPIEDEAGEEKERAVLRLDGGSASVLSSVVLGRKLSVEGCLMFMVGNMVGL